MPHTPRRNRDINTLTKYIENICNIQTCGGRCVRLTDKVCALYDHPIWTDMYHNSILLHFPSCVITVKTCESSLSGFVVMFELQQEPHACCGSITLWVLFLCIILCLYYGTMMIHAHVPVCPTSMQNWFYYITQNATIFTQNEL